MAQTKSTILAVRMMARRKANAAGKAWADLSAEERQFFLKEARATPLSETDRRRATRVLAKREAVRSGKDWKTLPQEERRLMIGRMRAQERLADKNKH